MWVIAGATAPGCPSLGPSAFYNDVWFSSDGVNWTAATTNAPFAARSHVFATVFNNQIWIMGGYNATFQPFTDAWYSTDGINWTQASLPAGLVTNGYPNFIFQNEIWGTETFVSSVTAAFYTEFFHD
jgi:hypothetical protein